MVCAINSEAQNISSEKNGYYTNNEFDFHWQLPKELNWTFDSGTQTLTVFRGISEYGIVVTVNVQLFEEGDNPYAVAEFYNIEKQRLIAKQLQSQLAQQEDTKYTVLDVTRCRFAGLDAIKTTSYTTGNLIDYFIYSYQFLRNGCIWCIYINCPTSIWDILSTEQKDGLTDGFGWNNKPNVKSSKNSKITKSKDSSINRKTKPSTSSTNKKRGSSKAKAQNKNGIWDPQTNIFEDESRKLTWYLGEKGKWMVMDFGDFSRTALFGAVSPDSQYAVMLLNMGNNSTASSIWKTTPAWRSSLLWPVCAGFGIEPPNGKKINFQNVRYLNRPAIRYVQATVDSENSESVVTLEVYAFFHQGETIMVVTLMRSEDDDSYQNNIDVSKYSSKLYIN